MQLYESGEMYLETILILSRRMENVRSIDIVKEMGFSKPSISNAMKNLREGGYISVSNEGYITFTDEGEKIAQKIFERHVVLTEYFLRLGVPEEIAADDACRIEHIISDETFNAIKTHLEKNR